METIIQNFNTAIGWSILHSLWQGACYYLILFGIYITFPKISSSSKYALAFIAQASLFLSVIYTFFVYLSFGTSAKTDINIHQEKDLILYLQYLETKSWSITKIFPYLVSLYSIGLLIQIFISFKSIQILKWIRKKGSDYVPIGWYTSFEKILKDNNKNNISLKISDLITIPITIGFFKPLIIIPTAYINNISEEEAEAILLHEFAHIKRHDYFFNIILVTIETIMFFNPFVWLISKHIKMERELACDDFASKKSKTPHTYASALLKVEILRKETASIFAMAASGPKSTHLFDRIKRINDKNIETKYTSLKHQLSAILLTSIAILSIAWISPNYPKKDNSNNLSAKNTNITTTTKNETRTQDTITYLKRNVNTETSIIQNTTIDKSQENLTFKELQELLNSIELENQNNQSYFESEEWKNKIAEIERNALEVESLFESAAWKSKIEEIEKNAKTIEEYFNSMEWKNKVALLEQQSIKAEELYNSPEYREKIALTEENARKLEAIYNSPEWKAKENKLIENSKRIKDLYNSPKYKQQIEQTEANARKIEAIYNSSEWKNNISTQEYLDKLGTEKQQTKIKHN